MKKLLLIIIVLFSLASLANTDIEDIKAQLASDTNAEKQVELLVKLAETYSSDNTDSALYYCEIALQMAENQGLLIEKANAMRIKGIIMYRKGKYSEAIDIYQQSIPILKSQSQDFLIAKVNNNIGLAYQMMGDNSKAEFYLKKALEGHTQMKQVIYMARSLDNLGIVEYRMGNYKRAIDYYQQALNIVDTTTENGVKGSLLTNMASVYEEWGFTEKALQNYQMALNYHSLDNNQNKVALVYYNMGLVYKDLGDYSKAIEYIENSLQIYRTLNATAIIPSCFICLGEIYCCWEKYPLSLEFYSEAINQVENGDDKYSLASALCGMGQVYFNTEIFEKSFDLYNESIRIFEEIGCKKEIAMGYISMAELYAKLKNDKNKAVSYFNLAQQIIDEIGARALQTELYLSKAKYVAGLAQYNEAIQLIVKSNALLAGNKYVLSQNYRYLADWYTKTGDFNQAVNSYSLALLYADSVWREKSNLQNRKIEQEFETRVQTASIAELRQKQLETGFIHKQQNRFIFLFVVFLTTLIAILSLLEIINRRLKKANQKIYLQRIEIDKQRSELQSASSKITESKITQEEIDKFKRVFLNNIGHEIKIPMGTVLALAKTIQERNNDTNLHQVIHNLVECSDNLSYIISDLVDYSKIEEGKLQIDKAPFSPTKVVDMVLLMLKTRSTDKDQKLEVSIQPSIPAWLLGDSKRLLQILLNLVRNAIKFSDRGKNITIQLTGYLLNEQYILRVAVSDKGIGIEDDKLSLIFESFSQIDKEVSRIYGGTGFGLGLVKKLIEMQKGRIWVESKINEGSTFTFEIPYTIVNNQEEIKLEEVPIKRTREFDPDHIKILLVEDNEINQELTRDAILSWGKNFEVEIAANGKIAVQKLDELDFDLILMDIQMPEMDGHSATRYIREKMPQPVSDIPIIGVTAHAISSERELALQNGMDDYITKPFNVDELKQKILYFVLKRNG